MLRTEEDGQARLHIRLSLNSKSPLAFGGIEAYFDRRDWRNYARERGILFLLAFQAWIEYYQVKLCGILQ